MSEQTNLPILTAEFRGKRAHKSGHVEGQFTAVCNTGTKFDREAIFCASRAFEILERVEVYRAGEHIATALPSGHNESAVWNIESHVDGLKFEANPRNKTMKPAAKKAGQSVAADTRDNGPDGYSLVVGIARNLPGFERISHARTASPKVKELRSEIDLLTAQLEKLGMTPEQIEALKSAQVEVKSGANKAARDAARSKK